jgi:hypothetical protein
MICTCWICWGSAVRKGIFGDWDDLVCSGCGRYKISKRLVKSSIGKKFDVEQMRVGLARSRAVGEIPVVNFYNAAFVGDLAHIE